MLRSKQSQIAYDWKDLSEWRPPRHQPRAGVLAPDRALPVVPRGDVMTDSSDAYVTKIMSSRDFLSSRKGKENDKLKARDPSGVPFGRAAGLAAPAWRVRAT
jgi:hypothetical protein